MVLLLQRSFAMICVSLLCLKPWPEKRLIRARALDTQSFVVGVNRIGVGNNLNYSGHSLVYDPCGEKIIEITKEKIEIVELDIRVIGETRKNFPSLKDKRFGVYQKFNPA